MSVHIWCTSWSVVGRGYFSFGLRPTQRKTLWMAWYPQLRDGCGLAGGSFCESGPASTCVWAALDPLGQAEHGRSQVVARPP